MAQIKLLVEGGAMAPGPTLSQQIGPLGVNMGQIISKINDATKSFKGLKVPVELSINASKEISIKVFSPPVSELLKKELGLEKGSGEQKKLYSGNASIEQIIAVASTKLPDMLCKDLKSAVKTVAGTGVSLGLLIEGKPAVETVQDIAKGKYDKEIKEIKTETSEEKKEKLSSEFNQIKLEQEKIIKQAQAAAEAQKAEAETTAAATPPAATGAKAATPTPTAATTPAAALPTTKKPEAKPTAKSAAKKK